MKHENAKSIFITLQIEDSFNTLNLFFKSITRSSGGKNSIALQCSFQLHVKPMSKLSSLVGYAVY